MLTRHVLGDPLTQFIKSLSAAVGESDVVTSSAVLSLPDWSPVSALRITRLAPNHPFANSRIDDHQHPKPAARIDEQSATLAAFYPVPNEDLLPGGHLQPAHSLRQPGTASQPRALGHRPHPRPRGADFLTSRGALGLKPIFTS
jgi:hypothetical protein